MSSTTTPNTAIARGRKKFPKLQKDTSLAYKNMRSKQTQRLDVSAARVRKLGTSLLCQTFQKSQFPNEE